jgi:hypothetical protein
VVSERTATDIAADLWRLRDEADALAVRTAGAAVREMPEGTQEALREATRAIYLGDLSRDALARLVIRALSPDLSRVLDERGAADAFNVARGGEDDGP